MKTTIKLEELALFALAMVAWARLDYYWWLFALLLLAPDLSMLGYLAGPKVGAFTYNLVHHKALAIGLYLLCAYLFNPTMEMIGVILFAHSSLDRVFGYGLKYADAFQHTHLGWIGKAAQRGN